MTLALLYRYLGLTLYIYAILKSNVFLLSRKHNQGQLAIKYITSFLLCNQQQYCHSSSQLV